MADRAAPADHTPPLVALQECLGTLQDTVTARQHIAAGGRVPLVEGQVEHVQDRSHAGPAERGDGAARCGIRAWAGGDGHGNHQGRRADC